MSVTQVSDVTTQVWGGLADRRLPIGMWKAGDLGQGDASGGSVQVQLRFNSAGAPFNGNLFSLEQIIVTTSRDTNEDISIRTVNLGDFEVQWELRLVTIAVTGLSTSALEPVGAKNVSRQFLGSQRTRATDTVVLAEMVNVDTINLAFTGQGYIWGTRARSVQGGPRYPPDGLYL